MKFYKLFFYKSIFGEIFAFKVVKSDPTNFSMKEQKIQNKIEIK